jgi:hypothetical protein
VRDLRRSDPGRGPAGTPFHGSDHRCAVGRTGWFGDQVGRARRCRLGGGVLALDGCMTNLRLTQPPVNSAKCRFQYGESKSPLCHQIE